jgi:hypothetical protein
MVALSTFGWFFFLYPLFARALIEDTCEEVILPPGGQIAGGLSVLIYPNATTRTDVQQGECSTDSILGPGKWQHFGGNGLNWRVLMSEMGDADTEAVVLEGNCADLRCVASSKDPAQGNNQVAWKAQNGTSYYIFTSGTSETPTEDSFIKFRASVEVRRDLFLLLCLLYFCRPLVSPLS